MSPAIEVLHDLVRRRALLFLATKSELKKRYAGSVLGLMWVVLNPLLFLGVYLFLYVVVFKTRLPDMGSLRFTIFVFAGLVPYIAVMEVANASAPVIRVNIALVRNLVFPVVLIPVRTALIGMLTQIVGLAMVLLLAAIDNDLSWKILLLPLILALQFLLLVGISFVCAGLGMVLPDFGYFLSTFLLFVLFVTPIGFRPEMVPGGWSAVVILNPIAYMVASFREVILASEPLDLIQLAVFAAISLAVFTIAATLFLKFRVHLVDYA
jgi:lipopolysaccharide transport system permease protein